MPPPVHRIELNIKHTRLRLVFAALLLVIGAVCLAYALNAAPDVESGWATIDAGGAGCAGDFTFLYPLGTTASPAVEQRALTALYAAACEDAARLFDSETEYDGTVNLATLNRHPNQEFEADPALCAALGKIVESGNRSIYLAPVYEIYDGIFHLDDPSQATEFDPRQNDALRTWFAETCSYANDPAQIGLELIGESRVRLNVSDEYLAWARAEDVGRFVDLYWMKNAFIADYLAERLRAEDYATGTLSSFDGYMRNLDAGSDADYALQMIDQANKNAIVAAEMHYTGALSIVTLRSFPAVASDHRRCLALPDGSFRTAYLDPADGLCKSAVPSLTAYAASEGCAAVVLDLAPIYISDGGKLEALSALARRGIDSIYASNGVLHCTQRDLVLTDLASGYRTEPID